MDDEIPDPASYPAITGKQAEDIARGLQSLAVSLSNGGMAQQAARYQRGSLLWMQRSIGSDSGIQSEIAALAASMDARFARIDAAMQEMMAYINKLSEERDRGQP